MPASQPENVSESEACSSVASKPTLAELREAVDAAMVALDAGDLERARAWLRALAVTVHQRHEHVP